MKHIGKLIAFGVFAASTTLAAHAVAINGSISGNDTNATFDNASGLIYFGPNGIVSSPPVGTTIQPYFTDAQPMTFNSAANPFHYSTTVGGTLSLGAGPTSGGVEVFQIVENNETLTYYVLSDTTMALFGTAANPPQGLLLTGTGYFTETGVVNYDPTPATFTINGSESSGAVFSFGGTAATVAATPEPSSLMLLGTGLLSAAGVATRKARKLV